jgi:hypothetical protein
VSSIRNFSSPPSARCTASATSTSDQNGCAARNAAAL